MDNWQTFAISFAADFENMGDHRSAEHFAHILDSAYLEVWIAEPK